MTMRRAITGMLGLLTVAAMAPALAQPGRPGAAETPKAQLFTPAPDAPVAPLIVPPVASPVAPPVAPPVARPARRPAPPVPSAAGNQAAAADPVLLAEAFYTTYLQIRTSGVPNATQLARLQPFLSPSLEAALAAAEKAEQDYRVKTKGAVPPLVEGDLFASLFEGASSFAVKDCADRPPVMECTMLLTHLDPATKRKVEWQDIIILARLSGVWRVHDIRYGGSFAFGQTGSLSIVLRIVAKEARE